MFVDEFPIVSQTFILTQLTGLADLGHEVEVFAAGRPEQEAPSHPELTGYDLLARTTYVEVPRESGYWELPAWPIWDRTWPPGSATSIPNAARALRAVPTLLRCLVAAPRLAIQVLRPSEWGYQARSLSALYRLSALSARRRCFDLLHAHFGPIGSSFRFARELWDAPLLVSFHGHDFSAWPRQHGADVYQKLFATADAITVNSEFTRGRVEALGCPARKLHKLPMPVHLEAFPFRERRVEPGEPVRVLTVGRLVEKKGVEYTIRAVARVRESHPEIRCDIIGDGPLRRQLEQLIRSLHLESHVTLHGAREREFVQRKMNEAHLFVLASVTAENGDVEGQGLVLQEAQASGLPVVATDHDGLPESIAPGRSGFLVPERDVEALADRLLHLIRHPAVWPEMGRAGRKHVEDNYDAGHLNLRLVAIYEQLLAQR
jgi:colanic acid/amylovoran biosynthesis glycosyltransferase